MELNEKNIVNVLHEAQFADADWKLLGQQLIEATALQNINANNHGNSSNCMTDTISQWLRNDTKASWEKLAGAIPKVEGYGEATADIVRQKAGIGDTTIIQNPAQPPPVQPPVPQDPSRLQQEVTHSKQLVDAVAEAVAKVDNPRGLAVVVTNEYKNFPGDHLPGMKKDGRAMENAFGSLGFATLWKPNISSEDMKVLVKSVVKYFQDKNYVVQDNPPPKNYVVAFVFSGHGGEGDLLIGEDNGDVHLDREIVKPLAEEHELGVIPKLFFIDACRGENELKPVVRTKKRAELITAEGNYYVAYSTIPKYVANTKEDPNSGSAWMQILAKNLRDRSEPVSVIVETTNSELWKMYETHPEIRKWQQPESVNRLHCGPVYLRPKADSPGVASPKRAPKRKGAGVASSKTDDGPKSLRRAPKRKGAGVRDSLPPEKKKTSSGVVGSKRGQKRKGTGVSDSPPPEKKMKKSSGMQKYSQPPKGRQKKK